MEDITLKKVITYGTYDLLQVIISNVRINDYAPAKKFYNQTQNIRQYYDFHDVDVDCGCFRL